MNIDFNKSDDGLVPAIIQDASTKNVLMLGYMNADAYQKTLAEKKVTFYSRTKKRLWTKGEESGHFLNLVSVALDCDKDTLLIQVNPVGPTCHKGTDTCWGTANKANKMDFLNLLEAVIADRKSQKGKNSCVINPRQKEINKVGYSLPAPQSYVSSLFQKGVKKVAQKVGEEAVEVVIEAMDNNDDLFLWESADLLFHYLVLLQIKGFTLADVLEVLERRHLD